MLETAIVGGGLCGLALADSLLAKGADFALFEARDRLGGRVLTVKSEIAGQALDMGATWYWPETQPRLTRLVEDLGLNSYVQHDTGEVLNLTDFDKQPATVSMPDLHGGARRVEGGMGSVIQALAGKPPGYMLRLGHVLTDVIDGGDHVELRFLCNEELVVVLARQVVLAMPPRLVEERVVFQPPLNGQVREAMRSTHTWMAAQAKALVAFKSAFWRDAGHSGNAFVRHEHTVLGEIFDACGPSADQAALGGFFSLTPEYRSSFKIGMDLILSSQLVQVFGPEADNGEQHIQDWAGEAFTCSVRDHGLVDSHPNYGQPSLRRSQWEGKLHFGGSETASYGGGYLEGALESAARIERSLQTNTMQAADTFQSDNARSVSEFSDWVSHQREEVLERYRKQLHQGLASQRKEQVTQHAVLATMEQVYSEALGKVGDLSIDGDGISVARGECTLTRDFLAAFLGFNKRLLDEVVEYNRTSCAISNFPDEHHVSPEYLETIARDLAAAWREFAWNVNDLLITKTTAGRIANAA